MRMPQRRKPIVPDVRTSTDAANKVRRLEGVASEPGLEIAPGRGLFDKPNVIPPRPGSLKHLRQMMQGHSNRY